MTALAPIAVAIALAASEPTAQQRVERRAAILSGVATAFMVGGGVSLAVGIAAHQERYAIGGAALIGLGLHIVALAIYTWLWPDDEMLALLSGPSKAGARAWLGPP